MSFFRGTEADGYPLLIEQDPKTSELRPRVERIACFAIAALRNPAVYFDSAEVPNFSHEGDKELMRVKVQCIFQAAAVAGLDAIVLGVFGCGAFQCPAEAVAILFQEVNRTYSGRFRRVVVALIEDHNSKNAVNRSGLVHSFQTVLGPPKPI